MLTLRLDKSHKQLDLTQVLKSQLYLRVLSSVMTHKLAYIMARLQRKNNET